MADALPPRLIAHLDMDAFYASVELLRRPELRGLPVVVGGRRASPAAGDDWPRLRDYTGRGVVTTSTYEARALGVHSGMGLMRSAALAPQAILLPADFDEYRRLSRLFKAAVAELAPAIEDRGIDEIYIDLSDVPGAREAVGHDPLGGARALAQELKNNVRRATGLSCSVGLAPNKLLAKICSDLDKPDGLTVVMAEDVASRIWPLPVRRIHGVGPKASARLESLGVHTIGELARQSPAWLSDHFGAHHGEWLLAAAHGQDDRPVVTESEPVSMSRETTFERDLHPRTDRALLGRIFTDLCERVGDDLRRKGYVGRTIGIKLRFDDFRTVTRDHTVALPTADGQLIRAAAGQCLKRINLSRRLRLLGVRVGNLSHAVGIDTPPTATARAPMPEPAPIRRPTAAAQRKAAPAPVEAGAQGQSLSLFPEWDDPAPPAPD
ncbi:DNA-directed DNA polymerase [Leptothrix cholodnii SP-6]|uniref:DNA polymerase IV n=1 Tax=Leptothrix cholodnii (strain ATCC 51168 / LMG 8142 / SP-6) TaxID=395495 RepID=B1Y2J3_LEPCP|nr:DNA polymerase IV [Leptothrix cholodnii]ACB33209.1 DNA-directed DNA polymerase [Leptothrix cholodnii SP-6]